MVFFIRCVRIDDKTGHDFKCGGFFFCCCFFFQIFTKRPTSGGLFLCCLVLKMCRGKEHVDDPTWAACCHACLLSQILSGCHKLPRHAPAWPCKFTEAGWLPGAKKNRQEVVLIPVGGAQCQSRDTCWCKVLIM